MWAARGGLDDRAQGGWHHASSMHRRTGLPPASVSWSQNCLRGERLPAGLEPWTVPATGQRERAQPAPSRPCHCGPSSQDQAQPNAIASRCPHCTEQTDRSAVPEVLASRRSNGNILLALPSHRLGGVSCAATRNWDRPPWGTSQKPAGGEAQKCRLQGQAGMVTRTPKGS